MSFEATKIRGALLFNQLTIITTYIILYKSMSLEIWIKCRHTVGWLITVYFLIDVLHVFCMICSLFCGRFGWSQGSWMTSTRLTLKPETHWNCLKPLNWEAGGRMMESTRTRSKWKSRGSFRTCPRAFFVI